MSNFVEHISSSIDNELDIQQIENLLSQLLDASAQGEALREQWAAIHYVEHVCVTQHNPAMDMNGMHKPAQESHANPDFVRFQHLQQQIMQDISALTPEETAADADIQTARDNTTQMNTKQDSAPHHTPRLIPLKLTTIQPFWRKLLPAAAIAASLTVVIVNIAHIQQSPVKNSIPVAATSPANSTRHNLPAQSAKQALIAQQSTTPVHLAFDENSHNETSEVRKGQQAHPAANQTVLSTLRASNQAKIIPVSTREKSR